MVIAFSGWNDAGEAATGAASHLLASWTDPSTDVVPELIAEVDPEDFYDFQVNRPMVDIDESNIRSLTWPGTQIFGLRTPTLDHDFVIVRGVEPSMKWKTFAADILDLADDCEVDLVVTLGAMLADTPHTRPITVSGSGAHPDIARRLGVEISKYEGPTGILGVIQDACVRRGIDAVSLWAGIPHYASNSPSPKATLSLINALEDFLEISLPQGDLPDEAAAWEDEVTEMAKEDSDVAEYVKALEESKDSSELPEATGESIARELERFLRRQNEN
jgi:proteasome assembly chaperone (PAC2) family protein